ncbi:MAG TPA: inositol monophosphatase [Acidimicrobiales bacterium]|nr:inositol monophosphatase [Acidimicrobiales bacterium]
MAELIRAVSAEVIEPRFEALLDEEVRSKAPGEVVTIADEEGEARLRVRLREIIEAPVIGEEACAANPSLLDGLNDERVWLVDPLDGTRNFVDGSPHWAVMVALLERGEAVASWMWRPPDARMYEAERGAGATCNGVTLRCPGPPKDAAAMTGAALTGYLDEDTAATVDSNRARFGRVEAGSRCAGVDYPRVAEGELDFVLFWRTLPWDHAPGVLLVEEAGGFVARPDGSPYAVGDDRRGLLVASSTTAWTTARTILDP